MRLSRQGRVGYGKCRKGSGSRFYQRVRHHRALELPQGSTATKLIRDEAVSDRGKLSPLDGLEAFLTQGFSNSDDDLDELALSSAESQSPVRSRAKTVSNSRVTTKDTGKGRGKR